LVRVQSGALGDFKKLKDADGVCELRFQQSSGIRIYFGKVGQEIIVLLCGGDKGSQDADIEMAKKHWAKARKAYG
jgi:putative addiction module killer protein